RAYTYLHSFPTRRSSDLPGKSLRFKFLAFISAVGGTLLSLSPLLIWDSQQHFANFNNILDYFLVGQYRLYVPNSWRLFIFNFMRSEEHTSELQSLAYLVC